MGLPERYPDAVWKGDGKNGGDYRGGPWKVVLHTTETPALPGYRNGTFAPHLTYIARSREWVQHTSLLVAARSLSNGPNPVETNRDSALQVEIVCYSDKVIADASSNRIWVGNLTGANLGDLRDFLVWAHDTFGVALQWPGKQAFSWAEANAPGFRMSPKDWDAYDAVCGHQHIPDVGDHWDPGALDWKTLMTFEEDDMPFLPVNEGDGVSDEKKRADVAAIQAMLNRAYDAGLASDGKYGPKTAQAVAGRWGGDGKSFYGNLFDDLVWDLAVKAAQSVKLEAASPTVEVYINGKLIVPTTSTS